MLRSWTLTSAPGPDPLKGHLAISDGREQHIYIENCPGCPG